MPVKSFFLKEFFVMRIFNYLFFIAVLIILTTSSGCLDAFFDEENELPSSVSYLSLSHKIAEIQPADKATSVTVGTNIFVTFNRPMERESVRTNFTLSPSVPGSFIWPSDKILKFAPDRNLAHDTLYTVKINKKASDLVGNEMPNDFESTFSTPMKEPEVFSTYPVNNDQMTPRNANIYIKFSEPVDKTTAANAFRMSPNVLGDFSWDDDLTLKFNPQELLDQNNIYTVTISSQVTDLSGKNMKSDYVFSFKTALFTETERPYVVSRVPIDDTELKIEFSEKIDKTIAETKENYSFSNGLGVTRVELRDDGKTVHLFTLNQVEGVSYTVSIKNITDLAGNMIDASTSTFSFTAVDPPDVLSAVALTSQKIQVVFSEMLGSASATHENNYFITPFLDVRKAELNNDSTKVTLETTAQSSGQLYEVNVSSVKDLAGNIISKNSSAFFFGID
jgi:hypothetical protein